MTGKELLLDEGIKKTAFSPELAALIGLNEAIFLAQLQYWISSKEKSGDRSTFFNDRIWIYNSYRAWLEQFPFWSKNTLIRVIENLESKGLILTDNFSKVKYDKRKWYTVNYDALEKIGTTDKVKMTQSENDGGYTQNGYIDIPKMGTWYTQNGYNYNIEYNIDSHNIEDSIIYGTKIIYKPKYFNNNKINGASHDARYTEDYMWELKYKVYDASKRLGYDLDTAEFVNSVVSSFFETYRMRLGTLHPMLSQNTIDNIVASIVETGLDFEAFTRMMNKYFKTKINTDYHAPHFFTEGILKNRAYETGYQVH